MIIRIATTEDRGAWEQYAESGDAPIPVVLAWTDVLRESYGASTVHFLAEDAGRIRGVCFLYRFRDVGGMLRLRSLPFGFRADDATTARALIEAVHAWCVARGIASVRIHCGFTPIANMACSTSETFVLSCPSTDDAAWASLRNKTRNMIRRAFHAGVTVAADARALDAFYRMYAERLASKGAPIHDRRYFAALLRVLGDRASLLVARRGSVVIGGLMLLTARSGAQYPYQATARGEERTAATQLLIWEAMRRCVARGIPLLDMGESRPGSPVAASKLHFGGTPRAVYYYESATHADGASPYAAPFLRRCLGSAAVRACTIGPLRMRMYAGMWVRRHGRLV